MKYCCSRKRPEHMIKSKAAVSPRHSPPEKLENRKQNLIKYTIEPDTLQMWSPTLAAADAHLSEINTDLRKKKVIFNINILVEFDFLDIQAQQNLEVCDFVGDQRLTVH